MGMAKERLMAVVSPTMDLRERFLLLDNTRSTSVP